jgi:peptidoglycan lytic transglycosylase
MRRLSPMLLLLALGACAAPAPAPAPPAAERPIYVEDGVASWYGASHQGKRTANGERFDMRALTAAHRNLPFGAVIRVTNLANGRMVKVRVNDRGPYARGRILDLSAAAAEGLGMSRDGIARVRIEEFASDQPQS